MLFNETGYLIPLVKTVAANQQGEGAIAPEPCWFGTNCLNKGYLVPCFILTRYLMNVSTNQEAAFMSPVWFSIESKYPCWKFLSSVPVDWVEHNLTGHLSSQWKYLLLIKYLLNGRRGDVMILIFPPSPTGYIAYDSVVYILLKPITSCYLHSHII